MGEALISYNRLILIPVFLLLLLSSGLVALADFELLLEDGQLLSGIDVRHENGQYLLELGTGHVLSIPEELVAEVRITAGSAPGVRKAGPEARTSSAPSRRNRDSGR